MAEGERFFRSEDSAHSTLTRIAQRLRELGIDHAVVGGLALFAHGYRRFTEDVDVLVTEAGLARIHEELAGRGYTPLFEGSKGLRDAETGVRIEFLITGQFPGDGKPKPVSFPNPSDVDVEIDGVRFVNLVTLIELKLASGLSGRDRLRDLADVQELIRSLSLDASVADQLDASVRDKYLELWESVRGDG